MRTQRPARRDGEVRTRIIEAAGEVFAERGFGGAGVDEIARRAGVNKAMLYYHVGDKAAVFAAVVTTNVERIRAAVEEAAARSRGSRAKLRAIPRAFALAARERPYLPQLMLREVAAGGANLPDEAIAEIAAVMRVTAATLAEGAREGSFRRVNPFVTHLMLVGTLMFMANALRLKERFAKLLPFPSGAGGDLAALSDAMVAIALDGIAVDEA